MKTHAIIPIFLPHVGCPHDCIFCNQRTITSKHYPPTQEEVEGIIRRNLTTISEANIQVGNREIAFFGGSFTGMPLEMQHKYLSIAKKHKDIGNVGGIRLSTRPDYINPKVLSLLRYYSVDLIELGVQSFDSAVLTASHRGHDVESIYRSAALIREHGFGLGVQLMVGLPGATYEKDIFSALETVKIHPNVVRLYPTIILEGTGLYDNYLKGDYSPISLRDMVKRVKDMYVIIQNEDIKIIRVGLKSTDLINSTGIMSATGYHPAFRQLVEGEIARETLESGLIELINERYPKTVNFYSCPVSFSNMVGNKKANRLYFEEKYPDIRFNFLIKGNLSRDIYVAEIP